MNFTNPQKWWNYKKADLMAHAYWERGQLPPTNPIDYDDAWNTLKSMLISRHGEEPCP